jgi:SulP family sulfate permease
MAGTTQVDATAARVGVSGTAAAVSAAAVTIPHALGLGLIAYAPLAGELPVAALALWSAAVPGAIASLAAPRRGVVYAPTTVVALLYAAIVASIAGTARELGLAPLQVLAGCAATVALGFAFQWAFGVLRLASLSRFLPISVTHGFAAGVGLAMVVGQFRIGFGAGAGAMPSQLVLHALAGFAVVGGALLAGRAWPRVPGLLTGVAAVAALLWATGLATGMAPATASAGFALPPAPDFTGTPWLRLVERHGMQLVSLALLMAVVNSLDVLVYNQELELEHGLRVDPNAALRRESLVGAVCALAGLIPASTSASRSRIVLSQAGPSTGASAMHALLMLAVAVTGHWWLHWLPMACLCGALVLAGYTQVPAVLWSRDYARTAPASWSQAWLVALVFSIAGGAGALVAGLVVATFVLLRASASSAVRRTHLAGELRSRRLRRAASDAWLAQHMQKVAVIELQGVMSFGTAAHIADHVRTCLQPRHERVILDATRVATWDTTAVVQLKAMARDLLAQGVQLGVAGLDAASRHLLPATVPCFADLDHALEWAEDAMLAARPPGTQGSDDDRLGEIGEGLSKAGHDALEAVLMPCTAAAGMAVFAAGDTERDLLVVRAGRITLATAWPPNQGLRLATIGHGMAFGEMAFLNGQARSAFAGCESGTAELAVLSRQAFDSWALAHPGDALVLMGNLATVGTRRLAATTRQLRAVLE